MTIDLIKEKLKNIGLDESDVMDFSGSEFEIELQRIVDFYNNTIEKHYVYKINKSIFYIKNDTHSLNALAASYKKIEFNTISITGRFVLFLLETFVASHDEINKLIDSSISQDTAFVEDKFYFQYLSVSHFIIYHELAHLIQFGSEKITYIEEFSASNEEYKHEKHIYELDADEFASLSLGSHLIQYCEDIKRSGRELKLHNVEDYVSVSLGAIFIVMVNLHSDFDQFYIEKRSHPHPITRLVLLSLTLIDYLNQTYIKSHYGETLDHSKIIDKALNYAHTYNLKIHGNPVLEKVPKLIKMEIDNIMEYMKRIRKDAESMDNLSVKAWNNNIGK